MEKIMELTILLLSAVVFGCSAVGGGVWLLGQPACPSGND